MHERASATEHTLAGLLTGHRLVSGIAALLSPRWWLDTRINPHSERKVFRRRRDAASFRADLVAQNLLGRSIGRERWVGRLDEVASREPRATPQPVEQLPWHPDRFDRFVAEYRKRHRPVVIKGLLETAPEYEPWDFDRFLGEFAREPVVLSCPAKDGYVGQLRELDVPGVYLHNSEELLHRYPELLERAGFAQLPKTVARDLLFSGIVQLFAGRKNTGTWWHCAGGMNLFLMLAGRKKWSFIDPAESPLMFPRTGGPGRSTYYLSDYGQASETFGKYASLLGADTSGASCDAARRMERLFARCTRYEVVLEPGDVLFVPAWWWHDVQNLTPASIGMATRWFDASMPLLANPLFDMGTRLNLRFSYRVARGLVTQKLVSRRGELDYERFRAAKSEMAGLLTERTRTLALGSYMAVDDDVEAYYRSHGYDRASGLGATPAAGTPRRGRRRPAQVF